MDTSRVCFQNININESITQRKREAYIDFFSRFLAISSGSIQHISDEVLRLFHFLAFIAKWNLRSRSRHLPGYFASRSEPSVSIYDGFARFVIRAVLLSSCVTLLFSLLQRHIIPSLRHDTAEAIYANNKGQNALLSLFVFWFVALLNIRQCNTSYWLFSSIFISMF